MDAAPDTAVYVSIGGLYMTRSAPAPAPILYANSSAAAQPFDPHSPDNVLVTTDFDFGWTIGFQARAGLVAPNGGGVEIGGFWLRPLNVAMEAVPIETSSVWLATIPITGFQSRNGTYTTFDTTGLHGLDANAMAQFWGGAFQVHGGVGYIRLHDEFGLHLSTPATLELTMRWQTDNRLVGPQAGARVVLGGDAFSLTLDGRVGYLRNAITNALRLDGRAITGDDTASVWSRMAAGRVTAAVHLSEAAVFSFGYQAMFLDNVALAPHQVTTSGDVKLTPGTIALATNTSTVLFQGINTGIAIGF